MPSSGTHPGTVERDEPKSWNSASPKTQHPRSRHHTSEDISTTSVSSARNFRDSGNDGSEYIQSLSKAMISSASRDPSSQMEEKWRADAISNSSRYAAEKNFSVEEPGRDKTSLCHNTDFHVAQTSQERHINAYARRATPQDPPQKSFPTTQRHKAREKAADEIYDSRRSSLGEEEESQHDPIQSPPFVLFSSNSKTGREHGRHERKSVAEQGSSRSRPRSSRRDDCIDERQTTKISREHSYVSGQAADAIRDKLHQQEARIESLERENQELRAYVRQLTDGAANTTKFSPDAQDTQWRTPEGFGPSKRASTREERYGLHGDYEEDFSRVCSPGTRFVTELAEVLELDPGHHSLLSAIMDNHYSGTRRLDSTYPEFEA